MDVKNLPIEGLKLILPRVFEDSRGFFVETYQKQRYQLEGVEDNFVQDNHSFSKKNVLRGMHFQSGQAKLVRALEGCIYDVAVDLRLGSSTYGKWYGVELDGKKHAQLYIPDGFAHGFCVVSQHAHVLYKVSAAYNPEQEQSFAYNDPSIGITWPVNMPILSDKDQRAPFLEAVR